MLFTDSVLLNILGVIVALVVITIAFFKRKFNYWKNLDVAYEEPTILFGNFLQSFQKHITPGEEMAEFYRFVRSKNAKHGGIYLFYKPVYIPADLDVIKRMLQVDFVHFTDHANYVNEKDDPLSAHLFAMTGHKWRNLRTKLTPTFTSGKMKNMFPILVDISHELINVLKEQCRENKTVEVKEMSARFTTDIIGSCAFGIDCNSLKDPDTEFRRHGKRVFNLTWTEIGALIIGFLAPDLARSLRIKALPPIAADFFYKIVKQTTEYREQNNIRRNDALQLLLDMKNGESKNADSTLTFNELAAQAFVFFIAGFETSSTTMSFALLELSMNEDVQTTLREEINSVLKKSNGEFTYEGLAEMEYLGMVINETLRKYPPLPSLNRVCTKDYQVPGTNINIKQGEQIFIPVRGIHYDPEYYPDPQKFDPMRFNEENKNKRHQFAFLPFGEGPRICIGQRFGIMQAKVGLASVIKNFKITLNSETKLPLKLDWKNFITNSIGGLWMDLEPIDSSSSN